MAPIPASGATMADYTLALPKGWVLCSHFSRGGVRPEKAPAKKEAKPWPSV